MRRFRLRKRRIEETWSVHLLPKIIEKNQSHKAGDAADEKGASFAVSAVWGRAVGLQLALQSTLSKRFIGTQTLAGTLQVPLQAVHRPGMVVT
jgi:hypothetical protein